MKRGLLLLSIVGLALVGAAVALQTAGRERSYRSLLGRGEAALRAGHTFGAIEAFSGAVALRPDSMLAHLRRGESYRQRGELAAAARDFRTAAALAPRSPEPLDRLGEVYYERGRFDRAVETFERERQIGTDVPRVHVKLALAHYAAGRRADALAALRTAIGLDARLPEAHYLLGLCLRDQARPEEAVDAFERAVTLSPGLIPAREELASLYEELGRYPNQLEQLQVLAALDSAHVQRQIAVGTAHARAGHPDAAAVTLANALERSPREPLIYQELGRVWLDVARTGRDDMALRKALEALDHVGAGPTASSEALTLYGRALALNGELDAAHRLLEQATRRFPVMPESFLALAEVAEAQLQPETARQALLDYQALVSDRGDSREAAERAGRIGLLSLVLHDSASARRWLQRALTEEPHRLAWLRGLAEAEFETGDSVAAATTLARALELAPDDRETRALARMLERAKPTAR
ncbi:MAG: tetratricopeptide repeat protein [Vicinamibacterales bacterium]